MFRSLVVVFVFMLVAQTVAAAGPLDGRVIGLDADRVADAEDNGSEVLISIHHNGSSNSSANYTQSFVTQKNDKEFAAFIHPSLVSVLGFTDRGIKNDGYGMTVYGSLPGILTESWFITNSDRACDAQKYFDGESNTIVHKEANALFAGLAGYFSSLTNGDNGGGDGGGGKPEKCSRWPGCRNN